MNMNYLCGRIDHMKRDDKNKKSLKTSVLEDANIDFENLTPEQIEELVKKVTGDLEAHANFEEMSNSKTDSLPPWVHFT